MASLKIDGRLCLSGCLILNNNKEVLLLYRKDHNHYETPGGKVEESDCVDPLHPTIEDFATTARRELFEELTGMTVGDLDYFCDIEFTIPDGRIAVANKFITRITSGVPRVNEPEIFSRVDWLPISKLETYTLSPDLKLLIGKIKSLQ